MPASKDAKTIRSWGPQPEYVEIVYDFAKDGGAVSFIDMLTVKDACVVRAAYYKVNTACTSGGSATVSLGRSGALTLLVGATAVASLTAGAVIEGVFDVGIKLAANDVIGLDIAVAALTAGKITVVLEIAKF